MILSFSKKIGQTQTSDLIPGYLAKWLRASNDSSLKLQTALAQMPHEHVMISPDGAQELILQATVEDKQLWLFHIIEYQENALMLEQYKCKALELENKRLISVNAEIVAQKEDLRNKAEDLSS